MKEKLTKSKERVRKFGEVYTPSWVVNMMLDALAEENKEVDCFADGMTFLEPACGNGNFCVQILWRKILNGVEPYKALQDIYGVDILEDNVIECRQRLVDIAKSVKPDTTGLYEKIVEKNIIVGDFLKDQDKIIIHDWKTGRSSKLSSCKYNGMETLF